MKKLSTLAIEAWNKYVLLCVFCKSLVVIFFLLQNVTICFAFVSGDTYVHYSECKRN